MEGPRLRVLVIEPRPVRSGTIVELAKPWPLPERPTVVHLLADGINLLRDHTYLLALLDLPAADDAASAAVREFMAAPKVAPAPGLIVLTPDHDERFATQLLALGADEYHAKQGLEPGRLAQVLRYAAGRAERQMRMPGADLCDEGQRSALERADFFSKAIEASAQPFASFRPDGRLVFFNAAYSELTGYAPEELEAGVRVTELTAPHCRASERTAMEAVARSGAPHTYEIEYLRKDGTSVPLDVRLHCVSGENGLPVHFYTFVTDITPRKRTEAALLASKEFLEKVMNAVTNAIYVLDREGRFVQLNPAVSTITGYQLPELIGRSFKVLFDERACPAAEEQFARVAGRGETIQGVELELVRKDGTRRIIRISSSPLCERDGSISGVVGAAVDLTERLRAEHELRRSERLLREVLEALPVGVWIQGPGGTLISSNRAAKEIWGGAHPVELDRISTYKAWWFDSGRPIAPSEWASLRAATRGESSLNEEVEIECVDGSHKVILNSSVPLHDNGNGIVGAITVNQDITGRKRAEETLRNLTSELESLLIHAPIGFAFYDRDKRYLRVNEVLAQDHGLPAEAHIGRRVDEVVPAKARAMAPFIDQVFETQEPVVEEIASETPRQPGVMRHWLSGFFPVRGQDGRPFAVGAYLVEITERKRMEEQIRHLALNDTLTGLANRRLFGDLLTAQLAHSRRSGERFALLFIDLDRFKEVNDVLGHDIGDQLLQQVATRLRRCTRASDTIARIGGDEFNLLLNGNPDVADCADVARKIGETFRVPFSVAGHQLRVTCSIGISLFPDDGAEGDTLLKHADIALYCAKDGGRDTYRFYSAEMNLRLRERSALASRLRDAIGRGELVVHYQPLFELVTRRMSCAEALVRWRHPDLGLLSPERFISLAEETGLIGDLDRWVLRRACEQVRSWRDEGLEAPHVMVNLSARRFEEPGLPADIAAELEQAGVPPQDIVLEISEGMAMHNLDISVERIRELAAMGLGISIHHFGSGYSSLNLLRKLPVSRLKIDRSFIDDIAEDADERAIVTALTAMAHGMRMKVVAEGVETDAQIACLQASACDEVQGYLLSRPVPAQSLRALIPPMQ